MRFVTKTGTHFNFQRLPKTKTLEGLHKRTLTGASRVELHADDETENDTKRSDFTVCLQQR